MSIDKNWWERIPYKAILIFQIVLVLFAELLSLFAEVPFHREFIKYCLTNTFISSGLWAISLLFCFLVNKKLAIVNIVLGFITEFLFYNFIGDYDPVYCKGLGFGVSTILVVLYFVIVDNKDKNLSREKNIAFLSISLVLVVSEIFQLYFCNFFINKYIISPEVKTFDHVAYYIDSLTGFFPCFDISKFTISSMLMSYILSEVYYRLAFMMNASLMIVYFNPLKSKYYPAFTLIIIGILGLLCYMYCPVVGSAVTFTFDWPWGEPPEYIKQVTINNAEIPRNCIPSLHMAWSLAAYWLLSGIKSKLKVLFAIFTVLTFLSTFYFGAHYLVDSVISVPFTLMCFSLTCKNYTYPILKIRFICFVFGFVSVLGSLSVFRFYPELIFNNSYLVWPTFFILIIISFMLKSFLDRKISKIDKQQKKENCQNFS